MIFTIAPINIENTMIDICPGSVNESIIYVSTIANIPLNIAGIIELS